MAIVFATGSFMAMVAGNVGGNLQQLPDQRVGAKPHLWTERITLAAQASGANIPIARVPYGSALIDILVTGSVSLGSSTVAFGDMNNTVRFSAAAVNTAVDTASPQAQRRLGRRSAVDLLRLPGDGQRQLRGHHHDDRRGGAARRRHLGRDRRLPGLRRLTAPSVRGVLAAGVHTRPGRFFGGFMAQGDSATSVANIALTALGEKPITVITENNKNATLVATRLDDVRRFVLRSHPWRCAKRQAQLAASAVAPPFKWTAKYPLPADFTRFYNEDEMSQYMGVWEIMDGHLYAHHQGVLNCEYIYDLQDYTLMDAALIHVIAYHLASEIGMSITQNPSRVELALRLMSSKLELARFINAQEGSVREWDVDVLLWARH